MTKSGWVFALGFCCAAALFGVLELSGLGGHGRWVWVPAQSGGERVAPVDSRCGCDCGEDEFDVEDDTAAEDEASLPSPVAAVDPRSVSRAQSALDEANSAILHGRFEDALLKGQLALTLDPSSLDAHKALAVTYSRLGKFCEAKHHYKRFLEATTGQPQAERVRAILQSPEFQACP